MGKERRKRSLKEIEEAKNVVQELKKSNELSRWETIDGDYQTLSYDKMQYKLDLTHPRLYVKEADTHNRVA
jgi:hypothetical protein